ncbi:MAG TPA: hypothetical protein G4O15_09640 [Dehalococcoidia bacterium]|nr:hypothetical protein [Dehalococcoidia bacterium]
MSDNIPDKWISTKEAREIDSIALSQHRIAELANNDLIRAKRTGTQNWLVKVTNEGGKWDLVRVGKTEHQNRVVQIEPNVKINKVIRELEKIENAIDTLQEYKLDLTSGVAELEIPLPIRPIFKELALKGIIKNEPRLQSLGPRQYHENYWVFTSFGLEVINYLNTED